MMTDGGVDVQTHVFLTSTLDGSEWRRKMSKEKYV
jgi:hypothetical protein